MDSAAVWTAAQQDAAGRVEAEIARLGAVRFAFADLHGVLRGKTLVAAEAIRLLRQGATVTTTLLLKDLSGKTAFPVFTPGGGFGNAALQGAADMVMLPDPLTFKVLPWAPHAGWLLCDLFFQDGRPVPLSARGVLRDQVARLDRAGFAFVAGIELECHVVRAGQTGAGALLNVGYQYLTELRYDEIDPLMETLRAALQGLDLDLRSLEIEFGPSQIELTFGPGTGVAAADTMTLVRSAVKQVCQRNGYVASFMSRPKLPNVVSSGWHLHQSLRDRSDANAFAGAPLSATGLAWLGGLLAHAQAACAFTTPTINGYKRYRPFTMAPTRACWSIDNRGGMVRVIGGSATRLENRAGEPGANPYLAMAAQIACGMDGLARGLDPGLPSDAPYASDSPALPASLMAALDALRDSRCLADAFGDFFIDTFIRLKQAEVDRFLSEVTEWEHNEYFELL